MVMPMNQPTQDQILEDREQKEAQYRHQSETDFLLFIQGLIIPSATGSKLFSTCIEDFQMDFFRAVEPTLNAIRLGETPEARRFWLERTKKASKDADIALCIIWLVAFVKHPFLCQVCASNQKQAGIIKRRINSILHFNPWLNKFITVQQNRIISNQLPHIVYAIIEATDAAGGSAHGETPDLLILNELVHVAKWATMEVHMNNADGTPRSVVIVATNAGYKGTKAYTWRQNAIKKVGRWAVYIWDQVAPWTNPKDVEDAKTRNTPSEQSRLWRGTWVSGKGDALDESDIDRCFRDELLPLDEPEDGWLYLMAIDLGISHDHAGIALVGINIASQRIRVALVQGFAPDTRTEEGLMEVDLTAVENTIYNLSKTFRVMWVGYDPAAGGSFMAQRLGKRGVPMNKVSFSTPSNLNDMAQAFMKLVKGGRLECYPDDRLRDDFGKFNIVPLRLGAEEVYKLKAVSDESGHADVGTALVILLPKALEMIGGIIGLLADDDIGLLEDKEITDKEVEAMPDELREIYDMDTPSKPSFGGDDDGWD